MLGTVLERAWVLELVPEAELHLATVVMVALPPALRGLASAELGEGTGTPATRRHLALAQQQRPRVAGASCPPPLTSQPPCFEAPASSGRQLQVGQSGKFTVGR